MGMQAHYSLVCDQCMAPGPSGACPADASEAALGVGWEQRTLFEAKGWLIKHFCALCIAKERNRRHLINALSINEFAARPPSPSIRVEERRVAI